MRVATWGWLLVCLGAAQAAYAQVPTDPLADNLPGRDVAPGGPTAAQPEASNLPPPYVTRQSDVEIPFSVKPGATEDAQPSAVRVFVSWDRGATWHFYDERRAEEGRFRFRPRQDGEYWFATQTIDRAGRPDSPEPKAPQLRLVVDTQRPQLLVQAEIDETGSVRVAWSAADPSLAPATLKIEYQDAADTAGRWFTVDVKHDPDPAATQTSGRATFKPQTPGRSINLRAEVADRADNVAYHSQRLSLEPPPRPSVGGAFGAADPAATRWLPDGTSGSGAAVANAPPAAAQPAERPRIPNLVDNPFTQAGRFASRDPNVTVDALPAPSGQKAQSATLPAADTLPPPATSGENRLPPPQEAAPGTSRPASSATGAPPAGAPLASSQPLLTSPYGAAGPSTGGLTGPAGDSAPGSAPSYDELPPQPPPPSVRSIYGGDPPASLPPATALPPPAYDPPVAIPDDSGGSLAGDSAAPEIMPTPLPTPTEPVDAPGGQRPRLTNSRRFSLEYDVESVGPEGVQAVELWGTTDGGRNWVKWGADPDRTSPFDVEVNSEAVYGFRIVIVGKNGLATSTPQPGDAADIWVAIDLTRPAARLTGAAYGQGPAAGKLDIRWEASDANLSARAVSLLISDRPDGAFTPIAAGLPNTGQYLWEFDPRSPRQIYLRLEVRDDAGNVAIDQLTEPIRVEGLEPKARIRGFQPASPAPEAIRGAFRSPLFR